ncbi:hypothetical protein HZS_4219 [Henneguya salminicola]|nr:hypothetical protein HZS_4219 [Henneguya salminicola]
MNVLGKIVSNVKHFYNEINPATLSGAIDIVVIEQLDGTYCCSPFHVKFGILEVMRAKNKKVDLYLNDEGIDLQMELGESGDAYFVNFPGPCNCEDCKSFNAVKNASVTSVFELNKSIEKSTLSDTEIVCDNSFERSTFPLSDNECAKAHLRQLHENVTNMKEFNYTISIPTQPLLSQAEVSESISQSDIIQKSDDICLLPRPAFNDFVVELSLCGNLEFSSKKPDNFEKYFVAFDEFITNPSLLNKPNLVIRINNSYYNWPIAAPMILSYVAFNSYLPNETLAKLKKDFLPKKKKGWFSWRRSIEGDLSDEEKNTPTANEIKPPEAQQIIEESLNNKISCATLSLNCSPEEDINLNAPETIIKNLTELPTRSCYRRSKTLNSEMLKSLNLVNGENNIIFSVTTRYQGTVTCGAKIFLWNHTDRIVISDVDGTITKSDVLGVMLPLVGKDWTQEGANRTRCYLQNIIMDKLQLPRGPILLSPSSLLESLHREVIEKKPEIFKIECLKNIVNLFPPDSNPLVSGFGNRINDYKAYLEVGVPKSKIFIINEKGQIKQLHNQSYLSTYSTMVEFVDFMFPLLNTDKFCDFHINEYNDFFYWNKKY